MEDDKIDESPLANISPGVRAFQAGKSRIEHFRVEIVKGIEAEIGETQNEQTRANLDQARMHLQGSMKQLIQLAEANPDRLYGAKILNVSLYAMYACANAVSRIERKLVPRIFTPLIEKELTPLIEKKVKKAVGSPGGKASGKIRHAEAEERTAGHHSSQACKGNHNKLEAANSLP